MLSQESECHVSVFSRADVAYADLLPSFSHCALNPLKFLVLGKLNHLHRLQFLLHQMGVEWKCLTPKGTPRNSLLYCL